jgi:NAD(P)-dependent dehydrogenase (short-subunit alcohol dehydrogenase family)
MVSTFPIIQFMFVIFLFFHTAYAPSIVNTTMWEHMDAELAKIEDISVGEAKAPRVRRDILLGRIQEPEDVAKLVHHRPDHQGVWWLVAGACL